MVPSGIAASTVMLWTGCPRGNSGAMVSSIARITIGTGHHINIADMESRRTGHGVDNQRRAMRDAGHALAHFVEFAGRVARLQQRIGFGVVANPHAKGFRDRIGSDVVMGGADTAGCEDEIIAGAQRIQRRHDFVFDIADNPRFFQVYAQGGEEPGDGMGVGVLGAARQDLVADHQNCRAIFQFKRS